MADCELLRTCLFFNDKMANRPATAELLKDKYCRGDNSSCARYIVYKSAGRGSVPQDMFPPNIERARQIVG